MRLAFRAWSWGKAEPLPVSAQEGAVGNACISSFSVAKRVDRATPALFVAAVSGAPIPNATPLRDFNQGRDDRPMGRDAG